MQTFFSDSNLVGPIVAKLAGVPIVLGSRRNLNHSMTPRFARAQRFSNRFTDRLLANSEMVKEAVCRTEHASSSKIDVIHNGIEVSRFARDPITRRRVRDQLHLTNRNIVIGNVANLREIKGVPDLIEAAAAVVAAVPEVRFVQIGEGELRASIHRRIEQLNLLDSFSLLGHRDDVQELLSAFDIAALTSRAEGFSNSILEYMAAGLPIVATQVGGNAEALASTGILVPASDPRAIAAQLITLARDANLRTSLGRAAFERVSAKYSLENMSRTIVDYYCRLLAGTTLRS